jgi:hypothetical protein
LAVRFFVRLNVIPQFGSPAVAHLYPLGGITRMAISNAVRTFVRRHPRVIVAAVLLITVYGASWSFRRELGLVHPMANLRYFYFGSEPGALSDRALYCFYLGAYGPHILIQTLRGDRYDVQWSDRRDPVLPTTAEVGLSDVRLQ